MSLRTRILNFFGLSRPIGQSLHHHGDRPNENLGGFGTKPDQSRVTVRPPPPQPTRMIPPKGSVSDYRSKREEEIRRSEPLDISSPLHPLNPINPVFWDTESYDRTSTHSPSHDTSPSSSHSSSHDSSSSYSSSSDSGSSSTDSGSSSF